MLPRRNSEKKLRRDVEDLRDGRREGVEGLRTKLQINILNSLLILFTFLKRDERFRLLKDFKTISLTLVRSMAATTSNFDINLY